MTILYVSYCIQDTGSQIEWCTLVNKPGLHPFESLSLTCEFSIYVTTWMWCAQDIVTTAMIQDFRRHSDKWFCKTATRPLVVETSQYVRRDNHQSWTASFTQKPRAHTVCLLYRYTNNIWCNCARCLCTLNTAHPRPGMYKSHQGPPASRWAQQCTLPCTVATFDAWKCSEREPVLSADAWFIAMCIDQLCTLTHKFHI